MKNLRWSLMIVLILLVAACVAPAPAGESGDAAGGDEAAAESGGTVTFTSWGGAYQEAQTNAYLNDYAAEMGVEIVQDGPTDYAKIIAMVEAGQTTWDIVDIENDFAIGHYSKRSDH